MPAQFLMTSISSWTFSFDSRSLSRLETNDVSAFPSFCRLDQSKKNTNVKGDHTKFFKVVAKGASFISITALRHSRAFL